MLRFCFLLILIQQPSAASFHAVGIALRPSMRPHGTHSSSSRFALEDSPAGAGYSKMKNEAARMRLEAEKMDWELTVSKLKSLEGKAAKLRKKLDSSKTAEAIQELEEKVRILQDKLVKSKSSNNGDHDTEGSAKSNEFRGDDSMVLQLTTGNAETAKAQKPTLDRKDSGDKESEALAGFDEADLDLYIPIAEEIELHLTNATADEKLAAFRAAPKLQVHFQHKMSKMLVAPMQDMQQLEQLKEKYLYSSSTNEKANLKREIDRLTNDLEMSGPFQYADSIYRGDNIPELTEEDIRNRLDAVEALPGVLQTLYKKRYNLESDADLRLAIMLDHYEQQLQLLEQVKVLLPLTEEVRKEVFEALEFLPKIVRDHLADTLGLDKAAYDTDAMIVELCKDDENDYLALGVQSPLLQLAKVASQTPALPEYDDVEFIDRSRYMSEFYPSIARLEGQHPRQETVDKFASHVIDKRAFMVISKPERVVGGWYIRGRNLVDEDDSGVKLLERMTQRLEQSKSLFGKDEQFEYFFLADPSPLTDEEVEMEFRNGPVLMVTAKNTTQFYNYASPVTKATVNALSVCSIAYLALYVCSLGGPAFLDQLDAASALAADGIASDPSFVTDIVSQLVSSLVSIQLAHEAGHKLVAWRDKFEVGLPTLLPSILTGWAGTITPLKSPPPSLKSLFDFAIAGPLVGLAVSVLFLVQGLDTTAALDPAKVGELPGLPMFLLRSSALGGGLIELFLGKGSILPSGDSSSLQLHPFAIAGFVGILANALALLPLGNTDGGRISVAMFGRRGTYIVKTFTAFLLVAVGIFGYDEAGILLTYTLLVLVWQGELEAPARNEVEELDFPRGAFGIATALLVALALLPMQ